jgi:ectoine hydroxylase
VDHPAILPFVVATLGWNIYCYYCHLDVTPPLTADRPTRWEWHQDGTRQNAELDAPRPQLSVKVVYFLSDVSQAGRGNLRVIPGSHRSDTLARPINGGIDPPGAVPLRASSVTAVIFDRRLWHSRTGNRSAYARKALFYAHTYRWIRPRDALDIPRALDDVITPIRGQLLGRGTGPLGHWLPTDEDGPLRAWSAGPIDH